jgi:hypothetical protein
LHNQLFFVRIEDMEENVAGPGTLEGLFRIAGGQRGFPCIMRMRHRWGSWKPTGNGWGLVDARTGVELDPPGLVTNEPVEMTDWEVHDIAVDFVKFNLKNKKNIEIISSQGDPEIYPSVWISRSGGPPEFIFVRAVRFPTDPSSVPFPSNWAEIGDASARFAMRMAPAPAAKMEIQGYLGTLGYFVAISIARADQQWRGKPKPLLRGHQMMSSFWELSDHPNSLFLL